MTIDEAIAKLISDAAIDKYNMRGYSMEQHKQIADWLEELKAIKSNGRYVQGNKAGQKIGYKDGYGKAIDDFYNEIVKAYSNMNNVPKVEKATVNTIALGIAEQLKAGN